MARWPRSALRSRRRALCGGPAKNGVKPGNVAGPRQRRFDRFSVNAAFVENMEDVLFVYQMRHDPAIPEVCMDEPCKRLIGETRRAVPTAPGRRLRCDNEYVRHGVAPIFLSVEPLTGWRRGSVTERGTRRDRACQVRELLDVDFPDAAKTRLVVDNLNTHSISSLYDTFPPAEARRLAERLEIHCTREHGSRAEYGRA